MSWELCVISNESPRDCSLAEQWENVLNYCRSWQGVLALDHLPSMCEALGRQGYRFLKKAQIRVLEPWIILIWVASEAGFAKDSDTSGVCGEMTLGTLVKD